MAANGFVKPIIAGAIIEAALSVLYLIPLLKSADCTYSGIYLEVSLFHQFG